MENNDKLKKIYGRIRYLISVKSGIAYICYNTCEVWNKDKNNYYYDIFLEKALYELLKN